MKKQATPYKTARQNKLCIACRNWAMNRDGIRGVCHEPDTMNRTWNTAADDTCIHKPKKFKSNEAKFKTNYQRLLSSL